MKRTLIMAVWLLSCLLTVAQTSRFEQIWNTDWRFCLADDAEAKEANYNDKQWRTLTLPHDWSIEGSFNASEPMGNDGGYLPDGIGWYRKVLNVPKAWEGKRVSLMFDGVYMDSKVYVNGELAGGHYYGYTPFVVDITKHLKTGRNLVAVRVDNSAQKNCRWYSGSGIYRNVRLIVCDPVHIEPWGVAVTTPKVSESEAKVAVMTKVKNDDNTTKTITLRFSIPTVNMQQEDMEITVLPGKTATCSQLFTVNAPKLWSCNSPTLYEARVEILADGKVIDSRTETFGIRSIEYDAKRGLRINGKETLILGGCAHHDNGILGAAAYRDAEYRRVRLMKDAGYNLVRTSHNPPSEDFLRACDELGLMVIDEAFDGWADEKNKNDYHLRFKQESSADVAAMVLRDRNHPSIICWSIGNEVIERKHIGVITTAQRLKSAVLRHDKTRPVTEALCAWDSDWEIYDPHAAVLDIVGFNYMMHKAESDHERVPERVMWQTESYPREAFKNWAMVNDNPYLIGDIVWTAIDYIGESGIGRFYYEGETTGEHYQNDQYPWHGAYCGDIDLLGWRKPISYYREMLFRPDRNKLHLVVKEPDGYNGRIKETLWSVWPTWECWNWHGHEGKDIDVEIYSRYPKVRLYLSDQLIAERPTTRSEEFKATITVPYTPGTLKAIGIDEQGNEAESRTLQTSGEAADFRIAVEDSPCASQMVNGKSSNAASDQLRFVTVELIDQNGIRVQDAEQELRFDIKGGMTLLATGSANLKDTTSYSSHTRTTYKGMAMAVLRSNGNTAKATLTISGKGIRKQIEIK